MRAFLQIEDIAASPHFFTGLFKVYLALSLKVRIGFFKYRQIVVMVRVRGSGKHCMHASCR